MIKPVDQLREEHKVIKGMLRVLEQVCQRLESGDEVSETHLEQILDFIKTFSDKCHHGKEEDLLFPAMEKAGIPREGGPIGVMVAEHDEGRRYVRGMSEAVARYAGGDRNAASVLVENARAYINLLTQHIEKEDNILFSMAEMRLSEEEQRNLSEAFEAVEREGIGAGKHQEYRDLVKRLQEIYLA